MILVNLIKCSEGIIISIMSQDLTILNHQHFQKLNCKGSTMTKQTPLGGYGQSRILLLNLAY